MCCISQQHNYIQLEIKPKSSIRFYTGFPSFAVFVAAFRALIPHAQNMYS